MTEGYFPGSSQPLRAVPGVPDPVSIPDEMGKDFTIGGETVRLYGIGEVAQLLRREPVTIRKWERLGIIPPATFSRPGANGDKRGRRRLYSHPQVKALVQIALEEGILFNPNVKISKTRFTPRVWQVFRELSAK